jgi:tetratricopeptide (TPR) repeat protein
MQLRPDPPLAIACWTAAIVARHPREAELEARALKTATDDQLLNMRGAIALWRGQFRTFEALQEQAAARARAAKDQEALQNVELSTRLSRAIYQGGPAIAALEASAAREQNMLRLVQSASVLAMLGRIEAIRPALARLRAGNVTGTMFAVVEALVLADDGAFQDAIARIEAVIAEQPRAKDLHAVIGRIRERTGDAAGAIASYETVIKAQTSFGLTPVVPMTRLLLAELLERQGNSAGARAHWDVLREQWKDADDTFAIRQRLR